MMSLKKLAALVCVGLILLPNVVIADDPGNTLVTGFARWQASRVEKIILKNNLHKIADDDFVQRFFPETSETIKSYPGESAGTLLEVLRSSIDSDVNAFSSAIEKCVPYNINQWFINENGVVVLSPEHDEWKDPLFNALQVISSTHFSEKDSAYTINNFTSNVCPGLDLSSKDDQIKTLETNLSALTSNAKQSECINQSQGMLKNSATNGSPLPRSYKLSRNNVCELPDQVEVMVELFSNLIQENIKDNAPIIVEREGVKLKNKDELEKLPVVEKSSAYFDALQIKDPELIVEEISKTKQALTALIDFIPRMKKLQTGAVDDEVTYAVKVHHFLTILDRVGRISTQNYPKYQKFQNLALLLSGLADAVKKDDADAVASLLDNYVDTVATYNDKRKPGGFYASYEVPVFDSKRKKTIPRIYSQGFAGVDIYLSSYYGGMLGYMGDEDDIDERSIQPRFFGPVGLELKMARTTRYFNGIWSINWAPFDIGAYITNELSNEEYTASFNDIVAPSYFISFSHQNKPVSWLFGFQKNLTLNEDPTTQEKLKTDGGFIAVTFDLPILTIY